MKILVCSIGSTTRTATLAFSAEVAEALAAETTLLGVVDRSTDVEALSTALEQTARELESKGFVSKVRVDVGNAEESVVSELRRTSYDLVALGALGGKRSRKGFLNSVGARVVEQARSSVLVIKGNRAGLKRVLICASGTERGHFPVRVGTQLACGAGAKATILHVVDAMPAMYTGLEQMEETLAELLQSETDLAKELRWASREVTGECPESELKLRRGIAADEILREGQVGDYDLIVLGSSHSAGGLFRVLLGNLAREVVQRAERPVLVVRPPY